MSASTLTIAAVWAPAGGAFAVAGILLPASRILTLTRFIRSSPCVFHGSHGGPGHRALGGHTSIGDAVRDANRAEATACNEQATERAKPRVDFLDASRLTYVVLRPCLTQTVDARERRRSLDAEHGRDLARDDADELFVREIDDAGIVR